MRPLLHRHTAQRLLGVMAFVGLVMPETLIAATGISPRIGDYKYQLCRDKGPYCSDWWSECTVFEQGTPGGSCATFQCTNKADPSPWSAEGVLLPKVSAIRNQPAGWNSDWLTSSDPGIGTHCWAGQSGGGNTYGIPSWSTRAILVPAGGPAVGDQFVARKSRSVFCEYPTSWNGSACVRQANVIDVNKSQLGCEEERSAPSNGYDNGTNPTNSFSGGKTHQETDYRGAGAFPLQIRRYFADGRVRDFAAAQMFYAGDMGPFWNHYYGRRLVYFNNGSLIGVTAHRPEGNKYAFNEVLENGVAAWKSYDADVLHSLTQLTDPGGNPIWKLTLSNGMTETYRFPSGELLSITDKAGLTHTLTYSETDGRLHRVSDGFGRHLTYSYYASGLSAGLLESIEVSSDLHPGQAKSFRYEYVDSDRSGVTLMLHKVLYPDETPGWADNPRKEYRYNEIASDSPYGDAFFYRYNADPNIDTPEPSTSNFPQRMTGIIDENGHRYATYTYRRFLVAGGAYGWMPRMTGHGAKTNGVYADQIKFNGYYGGSSTIDALGAQRTRTSQIILGVPRQITMTGPKCSQCGGNTQAKTYDTSNGFLLSEKDLDGNTTKFKHKVNGLQECKVEGFTTVPASAPLMRKTTTQWNDSLREPSAITVWKYVSGSFTASAACDSAAVTWSQVKTTSFTYSNGRLTSRVETDYTTNPSTSRTFNFSYTPAGLIDVVDGPRPGNIDIVDYDYDVQGNVISLAKGSGAGALVTTITSHDGDGRPLRIVDPNGTVTELSYHPRGWLSEYRIDGQVTTITYDNVGQVRRVTRPGGAFLEYEYDDAHRLVEISDNAGNQIAFGLNALGSQTSVNISDTSGALRRTTSAVFSSFNQLEQLTQGSAGTMRFTYTAGGDLKRTIDPRDPNPLSPTVFTENFYDALRRVIQVRDALNGQAVTTHDVLDNPLTVRDPNGFTTTYTRNGFGEVLTEVSPDAGTTTYAYDEAGNRTRRTDARGVMVLYEYDGLDRLTRINHPTDTDVVLTYDEVAVGGPGAKGRLTTMTDESGSTQFRYDARGNLTRKTVQIGTPTFVTEVGYDGADNLSFIIYPSGRRVDYTRDATGRISGMTTTAPGGSAVPVASSITWEPFGGLKSLTFPGGQVRTYTRDLAGRVTSLATSWVPQVTWILGHDTADNLTSVTPGGDPPYLYGYDSGSRLTSAGLGPPSNSPVAQFTYDANGNRQQKAHLNGTTELARDTYAYVPGSNRLSAFWGPTQSIDPPRSFGYDAAGNVTSLTGPTLAVTLLNGNHGRPTQVTSGTLLTTQFKHNGRGERVWVDNVGGTQLANFPDKTLHFDESGKVLAEHWPGGVMYEYLYVDDVPVAFVKYSGANGGGTGTVYYYHSDHLNTPRYATDAAGSLVWASGFPGEDPFRPGSMSAYGLNLEPRLRFPGQYYQAETGAVYNYFRDYDPVTGRYLQSDPIGLAGGLNTYTYANNNPLRFIDPLGLYSEMCHRPIEGYIIPGRHCFARFDGDDDNTVSFDPAGVHPDPAPEGATCEATEGPESDDCVKREMQKCENYHFTKNNCCHCVEEALKACGQWVPAKKWPNWPINPGPQPYEPRLAP